MAYVSAPDVQQWLDNTKLTVSTVDTVLEETAAGIVRSRLSQAYSTGLWIDDVSTPQLPRSIISMYIAGWAYMRAYSENAAVGDENWGRYLVSQADALLALLADGIMVLEDAEYLLLNITDTGPLFYPTDTESLQTSFYGDDEGRKFSMGRVF